MGHGGPPFVQHKRTYPHHPPRCGPPYGADVTLAAALALLAGFQLTVTGVVYPALADVPAQDWRRAHAAHGRRITPLVVVVYGAALAACVAAVIRHEEYATVPLVVALAASLAGVGLTATLAGPLHGRMDEHDPVLLQRLLLVDRLRCVAAVVAALAAVSAA